MSDISRRNMLLASLGTVAGTALLPRISDAKIESNVYQGGLVTGKPKPLAYKSLPEFLSEEQLTPHHTGHYGGALRSYMAYF